jgi:hypothetical protein
VGGVAAYFINRFGVKPFVHGVFAHTSLNDLLCVPFWVPIMVFAMCKFGLRKHDGAPTLAEIVIPLLMWSYFFEIAPPER